MSSTISSHAIAPANVLRGSGAWGESLSLIAELCQKPFVLGRSGATAELRQKLKSDLEATGLWWPLESSNSIAASRICSA